MDHFHLLLDQFKVFNLIFFAAINVILYGSFYLIKRNLRTTQAASSLPNEAVGHPFGLLILILQALPLAVQYFHWDVWLSLTVLTISLQTIWFFKVLRDLKKFNRLTEFLVVDPVVDLNEKQQ